MGASLIPILIPGLVAASIGYLIFLGIGDWGGLEATTLSVPGLPVYDGVHLRDLVVAVAVGVLLALLTEVVRRLATQVAGPGRARLGMPLTLMLGALAIGVVALLADGLGANSQDVLFSGQASIPSLVDEDSARIVIVLLAAKALAYAVCLGCGFRGGPVFPAIFLGVAVAMLAVIAFDMSPTLAVAVGTAAGMTAMTRLILGLAHHRCAPRRHGGCRGDPSGRAGGCRRLADDGRDRRALPTASERVAHGHDRRRAVGGEHAAAVVRGVRAGPRQVPRRPDRLSGVLTRRDAARLRLSEGVAGRARRERAGEVHAAAARPTSATTGRSSGWQPSTRSSCASSSSMRGRWSCRRASPPRTPSRSEPRVSRGSCPRPPRCGRRDPRMPRCARPSRG